MPRSLSPRRRRSRGDTPPHGGKGGVASVDVEFNALASCEVLYISRRALARCCLQALPDRGGGGTSGGRGDGGSQSGVGIDGRGREVAAMEVEAWRSAQALAARFRRGRAAVVSAAKNRAREQQQQEEEERRRRRRRQRDNDGGGGCKQNRDDSEWEDSVQGSFRAAVNADNSDPGSPSAGATDATLSHRVQLRGKLHRRRKQGKQFNGLPKSIMHGDKVDWDWKHCMEIRLR